MNNNIKDIIKEYPALNQWCILHAFRGSIAHGMYIPNSYPLSIDDKDTMAICVPPKPYYLGLKEFGSRGTQEIKRNEWDIVVYEVRKVISMLRQGNPNVLSLLWVDEKHIIKNTPAGKLLRENRNLFVGKHVYHPFVGYARAQLHKMEAHNFEGYMGDKRKSLVKQFGYDTKNAAHLIRLLRMGIEFLNEGELHVERHDASQLLEIKHGAWSLEQVKEEAGRLFKLAEEFYVNSQLPEQLDQEVISHLCVAIVESAWRRQKKLAYSMLE
jgi:predicted nucleotidyltransferase